MALHQVIGAGGMADTRDPEARDDEDPRKSISAAPSFEEYLKQRDGGGGAAPATAPATAARRGEGEERRQGASPAGSRAPVLPSFAI